MPVKKHCRNNSQESKSELQLLRLGLLGMQGSVGFQDSQDR